MTGEILTGAGIDAGDDLDDLIEGIKRRDQQAFECLFSRYRVVILRHIQSIVRDPMAAEDLVQETFHRVWERAKQLRGDSLTEIGARQCRLEEWQARHSLPLPSAI